MTQREREETDRREGEHAPPPAPTRRNGDHVFGFVDEQRVDAPAVGAQHLEAQARRSCTDSPRLRQAAEVRDHQAADGVGGLVRELRAEARR